MRGSCSVARLLPVHRQPVHITLPLRAQSMQPLRVAGSMPEPMQLPHIR